jgi:hypothetical protein
MGCEGWARTGDDATESAGASGRVDMPVLRSTGLEVVLRGEGVRSSDGRPGETFLAQAKMPSWLLAGQRHNGGAGCRIDEES